MFFRGLPQPLIPASCIRYMDEVKLADPSTKILMLRSLLKERIPGKLKIRKNFSKNFQKFGKKN